MRKKVDTGVVSCDLCDRIAVEVLDSGSMCEDHAGDKKYHILQQRINRLKRLFGIIMTHATAKDGSEMDFSNISEEIRSILWEV